MLFVLRDKTIESHLAVLKIELRVYVVECHTSIYDWTDLKPQVHFCYTVYMIKKKLRKLDTWFFCSEVSNVLTPFVVLSLLFTGMSFATS